MEVKIECLYCETRIINEDYLNCKSCENNVHIKCLKTRTPGDLCGDIFFEFKCTECSPDNREEFIRNKLPWLIIIVLALYNLSIQANGLGHNGYFHWRTHITYFIEKYWHYLFPAQSKPRKKWLGTVSGTLSHNNPEFFVSGIDIIKEPGWWKLTYNQPPKFYYSLYKSMSLKRQSKPEKRDLKTSEDVNIEDSDTEESKRPKIPEEIFSRTLPYMGRQPHKKNEIKIKDERVELETLHSNLTDFLANELSNSGFLDDITQINSCVNSDNALFLDDSVPWTPNLLLPENMNFDLNYSNVLSTIDSNDEISSINRSISPNSMISANNEDTTYYPRIIQVTNFQEADELNNGSQIELESVKSEPMSSSEDEQEEIICEKSLFTITEKRMPPWEVEQCLNSTKNFDENIKLMSDYEENILHKKLKAILDSNIKQEIPSWIRRYYRKLSLRRHKKNLSQPIFDLDNLNSSNFKKCVENNVLDRYQLITNNCRPIREDTLFHARLAGSLQYDLFVSPYTGRILHPFIYRNTKCIPPWIKLMCEIQYHVNEEMPSRASIDYCYVRPQHIAAVNGLLQRIFWSGIDMSECLSYPDFSIIALYKKLVVGCAFLVPDVGHSEAYVSFMAVRPGWQRCGIASFMLYHLTQTCMSKDITLHVSATNPAICLYQKFGFKIEEITLDFYDKYFPIDSPYSRHACFLRMKR